MILPFAKLGALALKTVSKPLAGAIRFRATRHPKFRELIINFAQAYHKLNVNMQRNLYGHDTSVDIRPLNEEKAVSTAADLLGELIVFGVGGGILVFEYSRSAISEARKEESRKQEREALRSKDVELENKILELQNRINELENQSRGFTSWLPGIAASGSKNIEKNIVKNNVINNEQNNGKINEKNNENVKDESRVVSTRPNMDNGNDKIFSEPKKSGKYFLLDNFSESRDRFAVEKDN